MVSHRSTWFVAAVLLLSVLAFGDDGQSPSAPKMDAATRMQLVRAINAEIVYVRRPFPMGYKGLIIKNGQVIPSEREVANMVALYGPAVKPGDQARITSVQFKGDNKLIFEINGGPKKKQKWYDRISIGTSNAETTINPNQDQNLNSRGSSVTLEFDKYVPQMGPEELKKLLYPVFDFNAKSPVEAYLDTVPPKVKEAIKNKQVLVGMNREMVTYTLGRPPRKHREENYEEWIYGAPPNPVQFIRFVGDEVVQLEIMKVDGEKILRTEKEIDLKTLALGAPQSAEGQPAAEAATEGGPSKRPSLKRPGEAVGQGNVDVGNPPIPGGPQGKQGAPQRPPNSPAPGPAPEPPKTDIPPY